MCTADGRMFGSVAEALRMANATMDYLNDRAGNDLDAAACGTVLRSLAAVQAKFTAAHAAVLARFDAADAHDSDGYGTSASWLDAMANMTRPDAKAEVRQMRLLRGHPALAAALAAGDISRSWALAIAGWTRKLPAELRAETIKILVEAARAGASRADLRIIAAVAEQKWRASQPDVHHLTHKADGGKTSVTDCVLLCQFHHDVCIHRLGWRLILHPDGTTTAYGPDGQVLHSHSPPTLRAG